MWLHLHFYILVEFIFVAANVITLIKQNEIKCIVTDDSLYSAVYLISPTNYVNIFRKNPEIKKDIGDWITVNSSDLLEDPKEDPILDQRWMDFEVYRNKKGVSLNTAAFSFCFNESTNSARIQDGIHQQNSIECISFNINKTDDNTYCEWKHYRIAKSNTTLEIYSAETNVSKKELNFIPEWLYFEKDINSKKQKYEFLYSNTTNLNKSCVQVNSSKCISMFVSVDKGCYLNITLESGHKILNHTTVEGFNEKHAPKKWRRVQIQTESDGENMQLGFKRHRSDSKTTGFWAIDEIQNCKSDFDTYTTTIANDTAANYICKALNSSEVSNTSLSNDKIGNLGNINCTKILGQNYSFCEEHKICLENQCHCAWGYQGSKCTVGCQDRNWGLDCKESCKNGCEICNATIGCTKCKEKYFGDDCSDELPVVKHAPTLTHIIKDATVEIFIQLQHDEKETDPDSYVIQYKNDSINNFKNYSEALSCTHDNKTTQMNLIRNCSYEIRIILIFKGKFFDKNVPVLVIHKKTLRAKLIKNSITLNWDRPPNFKNDEYTIYYKCNKRFCSNETIQNTTHLIETTFTITSINSLKICSFSLFDMANVLIDETKIELQNLNSQVQETELPKSVKFINKTLHIELEECDKFSNPLTYHVNYTCISSWCKNQWREWIHPLESYSADVQIKLDTVSAFTAYDITIVAKRDQSEKMKIYSNITTESAKHQGVGNLSVYSKLDDTLWIKWNEPYPPRGIVETYNITLVENESGVQVNHTHSTFPCVLWKSFICANISALKTKTIHSLTVSAKNYNVTEQGEPRSITTVNLPNVSYPPENLQIFFSTKPNEIVVKWEHPLYTYGKLEKFYIEIDDGISKKTSSINLGKNDKNYYQKSIPVNATDNEYKISVWGKSRFDGQNKTATAIISKTNNTVPILQWCTTRCYLSIQKISKTSFKGCVVQKKNTTHKREGKTLNDDEKNEFSCISDESGYPLCEIEEKVYEGLKSQRSCVKFTNDDETTCLEAKEETVKGSVVIPVVAVLSSLLLILILGLTFYICRKRFVKRGYYEHAFRLSELQKKVEKAQLMEEPISNNETNSDPKPIPIDDLEHYLLKSLLDNPECNEITEQFEILPKIGPRSCIYGRLPGNAGKNRYRNIIAYDDTRVILNDNENGDYINANYIDGFETPKAFIAAQAPMPSTVHDFWLMVCQANVQTIIMLNELEENGQVKSEKYWPDNQDRFRFGYFLIENISTKVTPHYIHQQLRVTFQNVTHVIEHYQYVTWPDHELPLCLQNFVNFIEDIMKTPQNSPVVVHCNAGCGRTGTFILSEIALRMAIQTKQVDFFGVLKQLRDQRPGMVSNADQYTLAHLVVWEYFFGQDFSISVNDDFRSEVETALHEGYLETLMNRLEKVEPFYMYPHKPHFKLSHLLTDEEKSKNRFSPILPGHSQIFLPVSSQDYANYINAVSVDSYRYPRRFIVTQQPLPNTIKDFWKLVIEYEITTIVSLNEIDDDDAQCPRFWPTELQESYQVDDFCSLTLLRENDSDAYKVFKLRVDNDGENSKKKNVQIIEAKNWKRETFTPPSVTDLLAVWEKLASRRGQIVVTCYDGATASGLFVALAFLLEKFNADHVCDVFNAVGSVRRGRSQCVQNMEQLRFLYLAALEHFRAFSLYENFK